MIRAEVKRRLVAMLGLALPDVHVAYTWAGDEATDATLWVGPATGTLEPESMERTGHLVVELVGHGPTHVVGLEDGIESAHDARYRTARRTRACASPYSTVHSPRPVTSPAVNSYPPVWAIVRILNRSRTSRAVSRTTCTVDRVELDTSTGASHNVNR